MTFYLNCIDEFLELGTADWYAEDEENSTKNRSKTNVRALRKRDQNRWSWNEVMSITMLNSLLCHVWHVTLLAKKIERIDTPWKIYNLLCTETL